MTSSPRLFIVGHGDQKLGKAEQINGGICAQVLGVQAVRAEAEAVQAISILENLIEQLHALCLLLKKGGNGFFALFITAVVVSHQASGSGW